MSLNNENKWNDVLEVSIEALEKRISLWDEIANEIKLRQKTYNIA